MKDTFLSLQASKQWVVIVLVLSFFTSVNGQSLTSADSIRVGLKPIQHSTLPVILRAPASQSPPGAMEQLNCNSTDFYSVDQSDSIQQSNFSSYTLTGLLPKVGDGLAIGYNIFEGKECNVFINSNVDSIFFYDGNAWQNSGYSIDPPDFYQCGAFENNLYLLGANLYYTNGTSPPAAIYTNILPTVADVEVDCEGNAWIFTGSVWPVSDTLRQINSSGTLLNAFPLEVPLNTLNGYGLILKNDTLFIGFGTLNDYPNKLLPVIIDSGKVKTGIPENFVGYFDLANCNSSSPLHHQCQNEMPACLPLPSDISQADMSNFSYTTSEEFVSLYYFGAFAGEVTVFNTNGLQIHHQLLAPQEAAKLFWGNQPNGLYLLKINKRIYKLIKL